MYSHLRACPEEGRATPGVAEGGRALPASPDESREARAARIHAACRVRSAQFPQGPLADHAMALMLTLFISELQGRPLNQAALAQANNLSR